MINTNQSTSNKTLVNFIPQPFMFQCRGSKYVVGLGLIQFSEIDIDKVNKKEA
jgi:hypothetical protein